MKTILLCALFLPIIYCALKHKKWYLYLLFAFYAILPSAFAIEISESLPLLTGTRMLILLLLIFWIYNRHANSVTVIPKEMIFYLVANVAISIVNLHYGYGEFNRIFILVLEEFLIVILIKDLIANKEEFYRCIDFMIAGSIVLVIIGVLQTVFHYDIASVLNIVESSAESILTDRMGMLRAYATSNAISYGCYCAFMIPIILYMYERTKKERYLFALFANLLALICTMSRSSLLALAIVLLLMLLIRKKELIKPFIKYIPLALIAVIVVAYKMPSLVNSVVEVSKSILNVLGADFQLSEQFGLNADNASYSRMVQWSSLEYMIGDGTWLFGYGYNAYVRGMLHYFYKQFGHWTVATTLDVGFVRILGETGVVGLGIYFIFLVSIFSFVIRNIKSNKTLDFYTMSFYLLILYVILNIVSAFISVEAFWLYIGLFFAYRKLGDVSKE